MLGDHDILGGGQIRNTTKGISICVRAVAKSVLDIPFGLNLDIILPIKPTTITIPYNKLTSWFSLPIIPTALFTQNKEKAPKRPIPKAKRYNGFFDFLATNSYKTPILINAEPIRIKSEKPQLTSFVNCIAINGNSKIIVTINTILINLKLILLNYNYLIKFQNIVIIVLIEF